MSFSPNPIPPPCLVRKVAWLNVYPSPSQQKSASGPVNTAVRQGEECGRRSVATDLTSLLQRKTLDDADQAPGFVSVCKNDLRAVCDRVGWRSRCEMTAKSRGG